VARDPELINDTTEEEDQLIASGEVIMVFAADPLTPVQIKKEPFHVSVFGVSIMPEIED
jgi:hypothetical protein